jgi:hypothetical protein
VAESAVPATASDSAGREDSGDASACRAWLAAIAQSREGNCLRSTPQRSRPGVCCASAPAFDGLARALLDHVFAEPLTLDHWLPSTTVSCFPGDMYVVVCGFVQSGAASRSLVLCRTAASSHVNLGKALRLRRKHLLRVTPCRVWLCSHCARPRAASGRV